MLKQKNLPNSLWGEVVVTIVHALNRYHTKRLNSMVFEEAWLGVKPLVKHFKIFGALCCKHILGQRRRQLDDKTEPLTLVGYNFSGYYSIDNDW